MSSGACRAGGARGAPTFLRRPARGHTGGACRAGRLLEYEEREVFSSDSRTPPREGPHRTEVEHLDVGVDPRGRLERQPHTGAVGDHGGVPSFAATRARPIGVRYPGAGLPTQRAVEPLVSKKSTGSGSRSPSAAARKRPRPTRGRRPSARLPTNQPSGDENGRPAAHSSAGRARITSGIARPERQCVFAATVTMASKGR